jgi:hypothetical protein
MRTYVPLVGAVSILAFSSAFAQTVDPALTAAIAARDKAAIARNADEVAKYTADDYFSVNPTGQLMNKKQRIDGLRTPAAAGAAPQVPIRTEFVRMYGPSVAVARMRATNNRQIFVWVKNPQGWQAAVIHIVPDAFPTPPTNPAPPKVAQPTPATAPPNLSGDRAAVFAAFKQVQDAVFAGDRAAYEKTVAPEFVRPGPGGIMRTASEQAAGINGLRAQPKYSNIDVRAWDQVGVVRWLETNAAGQSQWLTRVFAKKPAGWQQVITASAAAGNPPIAP